MTTVIARYFFWIPCCGGVLIILILYWDIGSHDHDKELWMSNNKVDNLKKWLRRTKTGKLTGSTAVTRLFDRTTKRYSWNFNQRSKDENIFMAGLTIGHFMFNTPQPNSLMWQWRGEELNHGFLYGKVDSSGLFTGDNIAFIYPDLKTGLYGKFRNGELVEATAVNIVAHRMKNGVKELRFKEAEPFHVVWTRDVSNETCIGTHPKVTEPHERKSVYVASSKGAKDEGLFARRKFRFWDLVSYYNGVRTTAEKVIHKEMTTEEREAASACLIDLGGSHRATRAIFNISEGTVLDVPEPYRTVEKYRTTLGHKANHMFDDDANAILVTVEHPVFGVISSLLAIKDIEIDEEIFVNYNWPLKSAPHWYRELYEKLNKT